ncbi:MAG: alanine--tRNA ligase-related protein [bacterium]
MTSVELRQKYLDFFKAKGHAIIPSASIMPENDPTTLFTSSGMQPLVPYLLGQKHPAGVRLCNSQKSFRAEDIEEVGDNRHTTFFEMLGNWSLGDYFKKEQLPWVFEFLVKELLIDPNRLYVTVFRGNEEINIAKDTEAVEAWKKIYSDVGIIGKEVDYKSIAEAEKIGLDGGRIFCYVEKKNWWSRSGVPANMPVGEPGGPDSEIFIDLGAHLLKHENSVWSQKACHVNCDCGRFIELGNSVFMEFIRTENGFDKLPQQNVDFGGGFERMVMTVQGKDNIFETDLFINILDKISELSVGKKYRDNMKAFEVIADHMRASTFIIGDDRGVAPGNTGQGYIVRRLLRRALRYGRLLEITEAGWLAQIAEIIIDDYSQVYPELMRNRQFILENIKDEQAKFEKSLEHGEKEAAKIFKKYLVEKEVEAEVEKLANDGEHAEVNKISGVDSFYLFQTFGFPIEMIEELSLENGLIIDRESFELEQSKHQELSRTASAGMFKGGLADDSVATIALHTAAHLMLAGLRRVLGDHVLQRGSNITPERLRYDFSHSEKMTAEQLAAVEDYVNKAIENNLPVKVEEMTIDEAKAVGAMGVFESKYGELVKVYTIANDDMLASKEICGGPHVANTGELGKFKIIKEESSSSGIRRIKATLA